MYKEAMRPTWVEINLSCLDHNIKEIRKKAPNSNIIGVIKDDAYGHGALKTAEILRENGVETFAVASIDEAVYLRNAGAEEEIILLGITPDIFADYLVEYNLIPVVCNSDNAAAFNKAAKKANTVLQILIACDTGMGRIGYNADATEIVLQDIKRIDEFSNIQINGLISHMSTADSKDKEYSLMQKKKFDDFYEAVKEFGVNLPIRTLANSAGIIDIPETCYEAVRPGIILYGCYPSEEVKKDKLNLKPVMSVKAAIVHLKEIPEDTSISYGRKYISESPRRIATIEIGYADGYPRPLSGKANVIVNGILCPVLGNICMGQCMVDVSDVPDVKLGDEAIIMGSDGNLSITAEDLAEATGTINYEILCSFGQRLPKVFIR